MNNELFVVYDELGMDIYGPFDTKEQALSFCDPSNGESVWKMLPTGLPKPNVKD